MRQKGHVSRGRWIARSQLIYALAVFIGPVTTGGGWLVWSLTIASLLTFTYLYLDFIRHGATGTPRAYADLGLMAALGFAVLPFNIAATTYVVYAAALVPLALTPGRSAAVFVILAGCTAVEIAFITGPSRPIVGAWSIVLIFMVGVGNLFIGDRERQNALIGRSREDVEEMATVAERERIARDLHDLLGHTLSVIALKSELASKLADRDPVRAVAEIREVERVSREALAEVRVAVEGYKGRGFSGELKNTEQALASAGVRLDNGRKPGDMLTEAGGGTRAGPARGGDERCETRTSVRVPDRARRQQWGSRHDDSRRRHWRSAARGERVCRHARAGGRRRRHTRHRSDERSEGLRDIPICPRGRIMIRVLIAEDQAMVAGALSALLGIESDIEVVGTAHNGREALDVVRKLRPDVLLTDIEMPEMTGLELAAAVRAEGPMPRVVVLTTFARPGY